MAGAGIVADKHPDDIQPGHSDLERSQLEKETVANDPVAGETVLEGPGSGNDGPTGGSPKEFEPELPENELAQELIELDEEPPRD